MQTIIKIGTRKSLLALTQTQLVIQELAIHYPNIKYQIIPIITSGDLITNKNLYDIGGKALFLKEIELALINNKIDLAIHSLKDMPGILPKELILGAVLEREDARETLICKNYKSISELPQYSVLGTSSIRRKILIHKQRPDIKISMLRGNIETRLNKVLNNEIDATIMAFNGIKRLGLYNPDYCHLINIDEILPSIGQGVIAIEIRKNDDKMKNLCNSINHLKTWNLIQIERTFLESLNANCKTPIAAYTNYINNEIYSKFMLSSYKGNKIIFFESYITKENYKNNINNIAKMMYDNII